MLSLLILLYTLVFLFVLKKKEKNLSDHKKQSLHQIYWLNGLLSLMFSANFFLVDTAGIQAPMGLSRFAYDLLFLALYGLIQAGLLVLLKNLLKENPFL